jgi:hypothetical protein
MRRALAAAVCVVVATPAAATDAPFLVSGRLKGAPAGTPVIVSVDVLGETGRIPVLATTRTDAEGRFAFHAPYDRRAARAARENGGAINFTLEGFGKRHQWFWEFSRRWSHGRWVYDRNGPMRGVVITAWR